MTELDDHPGGDHVTRVFTDTFGTHEKCTVCGELLKATMACPSCHELLDRIRTSYGERAVCVEEGKRFTWIRGDDDWVEESFSPMSDHLR